MSIKGLKIETHKLYRSLGSVWSDAIKENIVFNNYGWVHLSFSRGRRRSPGDLKLRLHLFPYVPQVIKSGVRIKESNGQVFLKGKMRKTKYYEVAYACDNGKRHITVVARKFEDGKLHYYSVRRTSNKIKKALAKAGLV